MITRTVGRFQTTLCTPDKVQLALHYNHATRTKIDFHVSEIPDLIYALQAAQRDAEELTQTKNPP